MYVCIFCGKTCKNGNSKRNHERLCKLNSNRQFSPFESLDVQRNKIKKNQFTSGKMDSHTEETKQKIREKSTGKTLSAETKKKLSIIAKSNNLGGHTSKKQLYYETPSGDVIYLQSSYEIDFAKILDSLGIFWERPEPFIWIDDNDKDHRYYPDFKVGSIYIDTKNDYLAVKDLPKIEKVRHQNKIDLRIVTKDLINADYIATLI